MIRIELNLRALLYETILHAKRQSKTTKGFASMWWESRACWLTELLRTL